MNVVLLNLYDSSRLRSKDIFVVKNPNEFGIINVS